MENASKALIIAGAILLAIVIISLGLVVVNNSRSVTENANLSEQEIQSFNAKFIAYEGTNVSGSRVNALIQQVIATNQSLYNEGDTDRFVIIQYPDTTKANFNIVLTMRKSGDGYWLWSWGSQNITAEQVFQNRTKVVNKNDTARKYVDTGADYTVSIDKYDKGMVKIIRVTKN